MSSSQITSSGFQFLLHTPHDQLWALLLQYLEMSEVCGPRTHMTQISKPDLGTENGYRGSDQLPFHVVDYGARQGKQTSSQHPSGDSADDLMTFRSTPLIR